MALHGIVTKKPDGKSSVANVRKWARSKEVTPVSNRAERMYGKKGK